MHDIAIIAVSTNESHWIRAMLPTVFDHLGGVDADVVIVDNDSTDGVADMVAEEFPWARTVWSANHGFGHANNRGVMTCNARYVLFLNPDTEILSGTFADMVALMDERPAVGLAGCHQIDDQGDLSITSRYFPNVLRALGDALSAERISKQRPRWLGERELDEAAYDREFACDWTTGSYMLVRREALESAGYFDERFFMYAEEIDLCRRIKAAGWEIRHLPQMTILHRVFKSGVSPKVESLVAVTRMMYARKHFSGGHRVVYGGALMLRHLLRCVYSGSGPAGEEKRAAARQVVATMVGRRPVPYAELTCPVAVATGDRELRDGQMVHRQAGNARERVG